MARDLNFFICVFCLSVELMFSAMCDCQALHPDPEDEDSDNDFEGEEYDVEEAGGNHSHKNRHTVATANNLTVFILYC